MPPNSRRVLIRGVNWLGDAVMTTPALQRLRQALPDSFLTLLAPEKLAELWQHHPSLDAVMTFSPGQGLWSVAAQLRAGRFQTAVVLPNSPRAALEVWLGGVGQRIGYAAPARSWFLSRAIAAPHHHRATRKRSVEEINRRIRMPAGDAASAAVPPRPTHQMHDYLRLVAELGANPEPLPPSLHVTASEVEQAKAEFLPNKQPQSATIVGLNPGAEYGPAKRWPVERFAAVVSAVSRQVPDCIWLAFGGAGDRQLCEDLARLAPGKVCNLAGRTTLRQLMALLKLCRVVLTNDTGPMHVAAALGTPVVVPFGSTSPELTGPGMPGDPRHCLLTSGAPCAPCFRRACPIDFRCMTGITPERVTAAVCELLAP